jgi:hypothetical protein
MTKRKRGRPPGRRGPTEGSFFHWLSSFELGDVRYQEFSLDDPASMVDLRSLGATTRYPDSMNGWQFQGDRCLLIYAGRPLAPRLILRIERKR